ncbi:ORF6N domain-containing protein [Peristeroidobacter soli]|jgi:hypothetical protein|uniref:hypothetical protein n=1 Tax=Peristeroidobacter soli TaxID=2497877 RepID=UPI00101C0E6A|nr:hypothetical protein [Peristeroidobacter soli]
MTKNEATALVPIEQISSSILLVRGCRVILDRDLAAIYGVKTGRCFCLKRARVQAPYCEFMRSPGAS